MDKNDLEGQLKLIFTNVVEWLKFAEAKNAAIIAADAATAFAAITVLAGNFANLKTWFFIYLHSFIFFVLLSASAALFSVIPKTKILLLFPKEEPDNENDNLLFYGHIAKYKPADYLSAIKNRYFPSETKTSALYFDYAQQIVVNSQITIAKYKFFSIASWLALSAILTPIAPTIYFVVSLVIAKNKKRPPQTEQTQQ